MGWYQISPIYNYKLTPDAFLLNQACNSAHRYSGIAGLSKGLTYGLHAVDIEGFHQATSCFHQPQTSKIDVAHGLHHLLLFFL